MVHGHDFWRGQPDRGASLTVFGGRTFSHVNAPLSKSSAKLWQIVERVCVLVQLEKHGGRPAHAWSSGC
ncbi:hypothetical protein PSAC2689_110048 [Paraburkholderia sacchari]